MYREINNEKKWIKYIYIIFILLMTIVVGILLVNNLRKRILSSYCVVAFEESGKNIEIASSETVEVEHNIEESEFTRLSFFIMTKNPVDLNLKLVNETTGETYYDNAISSSLYHVDEDNNRTEVCISVDDTNIPSKPFSKGIYHFIITNNMQKDSIPIYVLDDGSLNVMIVNSTYIGYGIALMVAVLLMIYVSFVYISLKKNNLSAEKFFLISIIPLSIVYFILFLPWSMPDADVHFVAAYRWANLIMGKPAWVARTDDVLFYDMFWNHNPQMEGYLSVFSNMDIWAKDSTLIPWIIKPGYGGEHYYKMEYYSFFCYLPQTIGICIARILGLGTVWTIYFGRGCMLLVYVLACYNAIKKTPIGKFMFATIPLLPISLMMSSAISYDPLVLIATLNFIACILNLYADQSSKKIMIESCIWAGLIGAIKGGGYIVLLPIVLILFEKNNIKCSLKKIGMIMGSGIISIVLFDVIIPAGTSLFQFGGYEGYFEAKYALEHPIQYINLFVETCFQKIDLVVTTMGGTHLAWMEDTLPTVVVLGLMLVIGVYEVYEQDDYEIKQKVKYLFIFVITLDIISTPIMLLSYTPMDYQYIEGLQGRYFLPILPLLYLVATKYNLHVNSIQKDKQQLYLIQKKCILMFVVLSCLCVFWMLRLYLSR